MKRILSLLLCLILVLASLPVFAQEEELLPVADGRDRPSVCGKLRVADGKLCGSDGRPVILRGVSSYGLASAERFVNDKLFQELSEDMGATVYRLAVYTYGVGVVGYATGGDKRRMKKTVTKGVESARKHDMYAIVDWHVLQDMDPNTYSDDAVAFFDELSAAFADYDNVLYEICNEPNSVSWEQIKTYADKVIPVIRANDPDAVIIVGTPDWSKRVEDAAADPLPYENVMYTLHFYAATHKDELRQTVRKVSQAGLPLFVTEYGVTSASGGYPVNLEEADKWIDLLEEEGISYCMWSFSNVPEPCSAILNSCKKSNGFAEEDFTEAGLWLRRTLKERFARQ